MVSSRKSSTANTEGFIHVPDQIGIVDEFAAMFSAAMVPTMTNMATAMGLDLPGDSHTAIFAIPLSSISSDLGPTEKPLCAACSKSTPESLEHDYTFRES